MNRHPIFGALGYAIVAPLVIMLSASSVIAQDKIDDLLQYIEAELPAHFGVATKSIQYKDFEDGSSGRMSVIGELVLKEHLVRVISQGGGTDRRNVRLRERVMSDGYTQQEWGQGFLRTGLTSFAEVQVLTPEGTRIPFRGEFPYFEAVDGYTFSGQPQYDTPQGEPLFSGQRNVTYYMANTTMFETLVTNLEKWIDSERIVEKDRLRQEQEAAAERARLDAETQAIEEEKARIALANRTDAANQAKCRGPWKNALNCVSIQFAPNEKYDRAQAPGTCLRIDPGNAVTWTEIGPNEWRFVPTYDYASVRFYDLPVGETLHRFTCR